MLSTSSAASSICSSQPSANTAVAASHHATENQLRSFFGQLLRSTQPSNSWTASRRYLNTSKGESLTTDQALAQMAAQDEAKKQKEKERLERKRKRVNALVNEKRKTHEVFQHRQPENKHEFSVVSVKFSMRMIAVMKIG